MEYNPFKYPPNYQLAKIHCQCSAPGLTDKNEVRRCPCCNEKIKKPFSNWWKRSIDKDFKNFGGSVVTYFWLIRLYIIVIASIIAVYSLYLMYNIETYCGDSQLCQTFLGVHIVSNQDLYYLIKAQNNSVLVRLFTLRGLAFTLLLFGNCGSLYLVTRFQKKYHNKINISTYSLIFKNVTQNLQSLKETIQKEFPSSNIQQIFLIYRLEPYNTLTNKRLQTYYQYLNQQNQSKKDKILKKLHKLENQCKIEVKNFNIHSDRAILVLNTRQDQQTILKSYKLSKLQQIRRFLDFQTKRMYCEQCSPLQEIIWNNIGQNQVQKIKYKYFSVIYFVLLMIGSYLILAGCMHLVFDELLPDPFQTILVNIIMAFLVAIALIFRQFMNYLSEMRHPNTQTHRTLFIVLTTVFFHLIYYLIIPTLYFRAADDYKKSQTLKLISNQTINFIVIQVILASVDLMYYLWKRKQKMVNDESRPIGCQKILHKNIQYPRFPIEFKLIVLFKFWSFTMFFAFQVPFVLFLILPTLIYLYFKDKHSVYHHYRMEIIDTTVQYQFLKVYSNIFSLYTLVIFLLTQHMEIQMVLSVSITIIAIVVQLFFIKDRQSIQRDNENQEDKTIQLKKSLIIEEEGYLNKYKDFTNQIQNIQINQRISTLLQKSSSSLNDDSMISNQQLI